MSLQITLPIALTKQAAEKYFLILSQVLEVINEMIICKDQMVSKNGMELLKPRTRGSISKYGLLKLSNRPLDGFEGDNEKCLYFSCEAMELESLVGVISMQEAMRQFETVKIRETIHHGKELFIDKLLDEKRMLKSNYITIILGPSIHTKCGWSVWTWFPGPLLKTFDGETIYVDTAVKVHNGV